jgi:hypothetical protein
MWKRVKVALAARFAGHKPRMLASGPRSGRLRNVLTLLLLAVAYGIRTRAERSRWDRWRESHGH